MLNCVINPACSNGNLLAFMGMPGGMEWVVLLVLGLLIFGRRLPEVGRSLGKGIVEFKKGIRGIDEEIEEESSRPSSKPISKAAPRQELPDRKPSDEFVESKNPYAAVEERPREE